MAKGFAHLGLLPALVFIHAGANAATLGSLLISEIMADPAAVSDARGEWFELYNPTRQPFNLRDITIGDDGSGLADAHSQPRPEQSGWGLLTMQQRAESIGGRFDIKSNNGSGTQIMVEAPL